MRRFNANKKRVLRELLNQFQPTPFRSIRGFNRLFGTTTNQTYNVLDDLAGVGVFQVQPVEYDANGFALGEPNFNFIRNYLYSHRGSNVRITYLIEGQDVQNRNNVAVDFNYNVPEDIDAFENWWGGRIWDFQSVGEDTGYNVFEASGYLGKIYAREQNSLATTQRIKQSFLDGLSHCVFTPIIKWCSKCLAKAESDSAKKKYNAKLNKIKKYLIKYATGIPEDDIESFCKDLSIKIVVSYPFTDNEIIYGEKLKSIDKVFKFINTRINHLEIGEMLSTEKAEKVTRDFIYAKINELDESKEFYYTTKDNKGYNAIYSLNGNWSCNTDFQEAKEKFEKDNGLNNMKICDIKNAELASFIKRGTHYNTSFGKGCIDYQELYIEDPSRTETTHIRFHKTKLIDQKKAYYNFKKCSYYEGFLGKITDFRETNKVMGVGLYLIKDIKINSKRLNELNQRMNWFKSNNVYTSAELKVLDNNKSTYKIIAGCWGVETLHFEFGEEFLKKTEPKPYVNENGEFEMKGSISYYAKTTGAWDCHSSHSYRFIKGTNEYAQILKNTSQNIICKFNGEDEISIGIPKKNIYSLGHLTAFILAYQRISLMEQLFEMDLNKLLGVYVDGIYYDDHEFKMLDTFEKKEIDSTVCFRTEGFLTNIFETKPKIVYAPFRENYKTELYIGAGGNGKTHYNLTDSGLINLLYVAPSHKLNANKKAEYFVDVEVLASLRFDNPMTFKKIMKYNTIVFDEVSMMSNEDKILVLEKYKNHKLIFCGDVGYQLPCISTFTEPKMELTLDGFDNIQEFKTNYRCTDKGLLEKLNLLREKIKQGCIAVPKNFQELFTECDVEFVKQNYNVNDMIISGTNNAKDAYTKLFEDKKKWYVTKNTDYYNNGDIVIQEEQPDKHAVIRHAYTAHSVQGETVTNKLFIDFNTLQDIRALYTAISRAKTIKQIFMVMR